MPANPDGMWRQLPPPQNDIIGRQILTKDLDGSSVSSSDREPPNSDGNMDPIATRTSAIVGPVTTISRPLSKAAHNTPARNACSGCRRLISAPVAACTALIITCDWLLDE